MKYVNAEKVLPKELVQEIRKHYTGTMYVTRVRDSEAKKKLVIALWNKETAAVDIALLSGLSVRRVHQILAKEFPRKRRPFSMLRPREGTNTLEELQDGLKSL